MPPEDNYFTDDGPAGGGGGVGKHSGFGIRSTSGGSQTATPSNPGPKDAASVKRRSFGPDKMVASKRQVKPTKPVKSGTKPIVRKKKKK